MRVAGILYFTALGAATVAPLRAQTLDSVWTIRGGTFAGTVVPVNASLAARGRVKFLHVSRVKGDVRFVGWNPSRLPAPVAFRPGRSISADDSLAFWDVLRQMESDMGMRLFEPVSIGRADDPSDVIVVDTKAMTDADGVTLVTWSNNGAVYDARVFVRSRATLHDSRIVAHEMMHALGFNHTSAWVSVMNSGPSAPRRLTAEDVAYAQLALESRARAEREDMWERLALADERESPGPKVEPEYELVSVYPSPVLIRKSGSLAQLRR